MENNKNMGSFGGTASGEEEYTHALEYLYSRLPMFSRIGQAAYKPGLQTSIDIDNAFGNPHKKFKSIHIAGTNGKGSVSHTLAAILQSQGYRTALYTSPHLADFRERIRIDGKMIPKEYVVEFVKKWQNSGLNLSPSFFELTMMMAFDWFDHENVDYAVIETGMGGRLDSTNIITPLACVITNISNDHTQFLGDTFEKIAAEKAGIIKHDIPVVIGEAKDGVKEVFVNKAKEVGAPIFFAEEEKPVESFTELDEGGWQLQTSDMGDVEFALSGDYQKANAKTILSAVKAMRGVGIAIEDDSIKKGMWNVESLTGLRGRWTRLSRRPLVICDTGHNEAGISYNVGQLRRLMSRHPESAHLRMVIGFVADKAIDTILGLLPRDAEYYFCNAAIPRALSSAKLAEKAHAAGLHGEAYDDVASAYKAARTSLLPDDILFIGGSTFVVADLLIHLDQES